MCCDFISPPPCFFCIAILIVPILILQFFFLCILVCYRLQFSWCLPVDRVYFWGLPPFDSRQDLDLARGQFVCLPVFLTAVMEVQLLLCCMYVGWDLKPNLCLKYGFLKGKYSNSIKSFFYLLLAFVCASFEEVFNISTLGLHQSLFLAFIYNINHSFIKATDWIWEIVRR